MVLHDQWAAKNYLTPSLLPEFKTPPSPFLRVEEYFKMPVPTAASSYLLPLTPPITANEGFGVSLR